MGNWSILINILFPVPLILLTLLSLPLPKQLSRWISNVFLKITEKVLFTKLIGSFNLYQLSTFLSIILFTLTSFDTMKATERLRTNTIELKDDYYRGHKWRSERNFWICLMSMILWLILYRVYKMAKQVQSLKNEISERDKPKSD